MKLTEDELKRMLSRPAIAARNQGAGQYSSFEKFIPRDHQAGKSRLEKAVRPKFRITITLRYSDNRVRDSDAAVTNILDCIVAARRSLANHSGNTHLLCEGQTG